MVEPEYFPAGALEQETRAPELSAYVPSGHVVIPHLSESAYFPASALLHDPQVSLDHVPEEQVSQPVKSDLENLPHVQLAQSLTESCIVASIVESAMYFPLGQSVQALPPLL